MRQQTINQIGSFYVSCRLECGTAVRVCLLYSKEEDSNLSGKRVRGRKEAGVETDASFPSHCVEKWMIMIYERGSSSQQMFWNLFPVMWHPLDRSPCGSSQYVSQGPCSTWSLPSNHPSIQPYSQPARHTEHSKGSSSSSTTKYTAQDKAKKGYRAFPPAHLPS